MNKEIVKILKQATNLPVQAFDLTPTTEEINGVVYKLIQTNDNGAVAQWRLEVRLITSNLRESEILKSNILKALVTTGDEQKSENILTCQLNGGGSLKDYNTNTVHNIMYFDLITRSVTNGR